MKIKLMFCFIAALAIPVLADPVPIKLHVQGSFMMGPVARVNVFMPPEYPDNGGHWSLTCDKMLSGTGEFAGTYDLGRNKIRIIGMDLKGRPDITKCEVFTHDWRKRG